MPVSSRAGQQHGGGARGEQDHVDRRVARARDARGEQPRRGRRARRRSPASSPPLRSDAASRGSRSGRCIPTVSISIAKPISPRNAIVPLAGFTASSTAGPTRMPARISPITTGTNRRPATPSSGPPSPASTITISVPKLTVRPAYAVSFSHTCWSVEWGVGREPALPLQSLLTGSRHDRRPWRRVAAEQQRRSSSAPQTMKG